MPRILFDSSHNEYLRIGRKGYEYFDVQPDRLDWSMLALSLERFGFDISTLDSGTIPENLHELCDVFVIGDPENHFYHSLPIESDGVETNIGKYSSEEIETILSFVKEGGGLLILQEKYGESRRGNNLNLILSHFGFKFNSDLVESSKNYSNKNSWVLINDFREHPTTQELEQICYFEGCSISKLSSADEESFDFEPVFLAGSEAHPSKAILSIAGKYGKGKVFAMGDATMFTEYGLCASFTFCEQHRRFLWNLFRWLVPENTLKHVAVKNSNAASLLTRICIDKVEDVSNTLIDTRKEISDLNKSIKQLESDYSENAKKVEQLSDVVDSLFDIFTQDIKKTLWERFADVIFNIILMITSFAFSLYIASKADTLSETAVILILIFSIITALVLRVFGIPIITEIGKNIKKKKDDEK